MKETETRFSKKKEPVPDAMPLQIDQKEEGDFSIATTCLVFDSEKQRTDDDDNNNYLVS